MKHVMLAFVSPVNARYLREPITYPNVMGEPYTSIQTNESALVYIERMLGRDQLSRIFLIASDKVRNELVPQPNEFGALNHLDFLQRRVIKECPELDGKFSVLDYSDAVDESAKLDKNILQIADIADAITDYAANFSGEPIKIHADMTGGFRHASMMMLSIIQLLRYRGVETGEIIYSDPNVPIVYRATEIQKMFSLINGADEFVKFGSVDAVYEYFGADPPEPLSDLLRAMKTFSEAIKICRTGTIESELKNLGRHIQTFREHKGKDVKSELFAKIIETIEREYGNLLRADVKRLDIIRWCMSKGFWQQAMTLCTEWLPEEIVDRGICKPTDDRIARDAELDGMSFGRGWKQHLIISYSGRRNSTDQQEAMLNDFFRPIRAALNDLSNPFALTMIKDYKRLKQFADEYARARAAFNNYKAGRLKLDELKSRYPMLHRALKAIHDFRNRNLIIRKEFSSTVRTLDYDKLMLSLESLPSDELLELFEIDASAIKEATVDKKTIEKAERRWSNREATYRAMMRDGVLCSNVDAETALDLLHGYYDIRNERNQVNHANSGSTTDIATLEKMINSYLQRLERY